MIHIGLCADERFSLPFGVCLTSIFESNADNDIIIHVLTKGFKDETLTRIAKTEEKYNKTGTVKLYEVDDRFFEGYPVYDNFPKSIYYRYLFADVLPKGIDKLLYIDCDTVVVDSLRPLWESLLNDKLFAAVEDRNGDDILIRNRLEMWRGKYYNSGVLLMNLSFWRNNDCFNKMANYILTNPEVCLYPDQDAINVLFQDNIQPVSFRYNFSMSFINPFESYRLHKCKWSDIALSFKNLVIIHFAAEKKPWFREEKHPLFFIWHYFYKKSLWNHVRLKYSQPLILVWAKKIMRYLIYRNTKTPINPLFTNDLNRYKKQYLSE